MARRLLISLEEAALTFGGKHLFEGLNLYINEGDKICLVGKNGAGKTTLMRLLKGELDMDGGKRFVLPNTTIGYLEQKVDFKPNENVHQFVLSAIAPEDREEKSHMADIIIGPLEIDPTALMSTLSGGQLRRAALARALIEEPDLLMLDEPTNHLDLGAIEWLEQYLKGYKGALVCVSHDRAFLANISKKVFWIDRGSIRTCPKGYADFDEWAEMIIEQEARELQNLQKKIESEIDWTQGGVTGRRKRNVRRMRELGRLREKIRADRAAYKKATEKVEIDALEVAQASARIAEFKHVYKSFTRSDGSELEVLRDFNLNIMRGDRIGILGKNGSGKSTFLKLLASELKPDKGTVKLGKTVEVSYFDQYRSDLNPKFTLWKTLCPDGGDYVTLGGGSKIRQRHVCGYLKDFLFDPKLARDYVSTLSGGQQNRLMLAKLLARPGNLLILDEPTNDLDMDTLDILTDILADYPGTLIIVSHDRDFLDRTVTEVLAFEGSGNVQSYIGGYSDYLEARAIAEGKTIEKRAKPTEIEPVTPAIQNKMPNKLKYELEKLPEKIKKLNEEIAELQNLLSDPKLYTEQPEVFDKSSRRLGRAQNELEQNESRWLELDEMNQQY